MWLCGYFRIALWEKLSLEPTLESWQRTRWPNVRQQSVPDSCSDNKESAVTDRSDHFSIIFTTMPTSLLANIQKSKSSPSTYTAHYVVSCWQKSLKRLRHFLLGPIKNTFTHFMDLTVALKLKPCDVILHTTTILWLDRPKMEWAKNRQHRP